MIYVTLEGGLVTGIHSDDPKLAGQYAIVVDYDTEGAGDEELTTVLHGEHEDIGTTAYCSRALIEAAKIRVPELEAYDAAQ